MRRAHFIAVVLLTALPFGSGLAGQEEGSVEVSLLGRYNVYDAGVGIDGALAVGARLGLFIRPTLVLELEGVYAEPRATDLDERFVHELYQVRLVLQHWLGDRAVLLLGGGLAYDHYAQDRTVGARGGGPAGLMGLRYRVRDRVFLRFEGTGYLVPPNQGAEPIARVESLNLGVQLGVTVLLDPPES